MTLQSNGKEKTNMMKFGLLTSICEGMTFEEVVNFAAENQLECLEVAAGHRAAHREDMRV